MKGAIATVQEGAAVFTFAVVIVAKLHWFCQTFFPSNIIIRRLRRRDAFKWGVPAGLAGTAVYYGLFLLVSTGYEDWGWPAWVRFLGIPVVMSMIKFLVLIPVSVFWLARARVREYLLVRSVERDLRRNGELPDGEKRLPAEQRHQLRDWARELSPPAI